MLKSKYLTLFSIVQCEWNDWQIGPCSKTCGGGTRINHRTKKIEEANGGNCEGEATIEEVCNAQVFMREKERDMEREFARLREQHIAATIAAQAAAA